VLITRDYCQNEKVKERAIDRARGEMRNERLKVSSSRVQQRRDNKSHAIRFVFISDYGFYGKALNGNMFAELPLSPGSRNIEIH